MSKTTLPTATDVTNALGALTPPITLSGSFDVAAEVAAAIDEWNERTHYRPFFQSSGTATSRAFDPPGPAREGSSRGGKSRLTLGNGLLSLTSVYTSVNTAYSDPGTLLTLGVDFWLWPANAVAEGHPYTHIDFAVNQRNLPQSVVVTGVWGYCNASTAVPDSAWAGIRDLATARTLETYLEGLKTGLVAWSEEDVHETFDAGLIASLGQGFRRRAEKALYRYRLLDF